MSAFVFQRTIKFADVDPAQIVFYPRYFEMINETVEEWFRLELKSDFRTMAGSNRGTPLVNVETEFRRPGYLYDEIGLKLTPLRVGRSSLKLRIEASRGDTLLFQAGLTLVHIDLTTGKPVSWPDDLRERIKSGIGPGEAGESLEGS